MKFFRQVIVTCVTVVAMSVVAFVPAYAAPTQDFWCGVVKDGTSGIFNTFDDCGAVLPTSKTNLHIIAQGATKTTGVYSESLWLQMNGDLGNNYDYTTGPVYNAGAIRIADFPAMSYRDGVVDIWIPNYNSTALVKEAISLEMLSAANGIGIGNDGGVWHPVSPVAVQHVTLYLAGTSLFTSGTRFDVYTE